MIFIFILWQINSGKQAMNAYEYMQLKSDRELFDKTQDKYKDNAK